MLFWGFNNISDTKMVSFYVILLRNGLNFCNVHGIMNTSGLLQSK